MPRRAETSSARRMDSVLLRHGMARSPPPGRALPSNSSVLIESDTRHSMDRAALLAEYPLIQLRLRTPTQGIFVRRIIYRRARATPRRQPPVSVEKENRKPIPLLN